YVSTSEVIRTNTSRLTCRRIVAAPAGTLVARLVPEVTCTAITPATVSTRIRSTLSRCRSAREVTTVNPTRLGPAGVREQSKSAVRPRSAGGRPAQPVLAGGPARQRHVHPDPAVRHVARTDRPAVALDHVAGDGQAEAGAVAVPGPVGAEEPV